MMSLTSKGPLSTTSWRYRIPDVLAGLFLLGLCLVILIPFFWMLSTSLKSAVEVFRVPIQWIPEKLRWENYPIGLSRRAFGVY